MSERDLRDLMASIDGDDPSPEFVSKLRERLEAELSEETQFPSEVTLTLAEGPADVKEQSMKRAWLIGGIGAAAAAVAIIVGVVVADNGDDSGDLVNAADSTSTATTEVLADEPAIEPSTAPDSGDGAGQPAADQTAVDPPSIVVEPATVDAPGEYEFTVSGSGFKNNQHPVTVAPCLVPSSGDLSEIDPNDNDVCDHDQWVLATSPSQAFSDSFEGTFEVTATYYVPEEGLVIGADAFPLEDGQPNVAAFHLVRVTDE